MKFQPQVELIYNNFLQNTVCGNQLNECQLTVIKRYFEKCWETGFAQGYSESYRDSQKAFV